MGKLKEIANFQARLANGGARSNLFEVQIPTLPTIVSDSLDKLAQDNAVKALPAGAGQKQIDEANETTAWRGSSGISQVFKFLCKGAQFPASNIGTVEIPFRGFLIIRNKWQLAEVYGLPV